jgi:hypothetical protein
MRYFESPPPLAGMAELADAADSKSADPCGHGGSTPPPGTNSFYLESLVYDSSKSGVCAMRWSFYARSMLTIFRRLASCKHSSKRRKYRSCACPNSVEVTLRGEKFRKSLDLRNWEAGNKLVGDWGVNGAAVVATVRQATGRFVSDRESMKLSDAMMRKYRLRISARSLRAPLLWERFIDRSRH